MMCVYFVYVYVVWGDMLHVCICCVHGEKTRYLKFTLSENFKGAIS